VKTLMNDNNILLVEDNPQLQKYIGEYLSAYAYCPVKGFINFSKISAIPANSGNSGETHSA
jgi:hypothetical protein